MSSARRHRTSKALALALLGSFALVGANACAQPGEAKTSAKEPDAKALTKPEDKSNDKPSGKPWGKRKSPPPVT
ncbi:MAG TPA: hypothetical protein ENJ18_02225 [Nannocystis exedens]|nr:hypothetical protein [Nannocystis exedens]